MELHWIPPKASLRRLSLLQNYLAVSETIRTERKGKGEAKGEISVPDFMQAAFE